MLVFDAPPQGLFRYGAKAKNVAGIFNSKPPGSRKRRVQPAFRASNPLIHP